MALFVGAAAPALAQVGTVEGRVLNAQTNEPVPGANVALEGTTVGASTDADGEFSFSAPAGEYTLAATFLGYLRATRPVSVRAGETVRVEMTIEEDLLGLEEVYVVGYGTTSELARTGSVARVGEEEIEGSVVNSFEQVLQGRTAGVAVQTNNGKLGQGIQVRVRGAASVSAGNEPLYVVDGIPVSTDNISTNTASTNPLAQINPSDIASIEVLKDASATAIYGARASNGVVLITTKSGFDGDTQFAVNLRGSASSPTHTVEFLNAQEYVELLTEAAENSDRITGGGGYLAFLERSFDGLAAGTDWRSGEVDSDWQEEAFQDASGFTVDLSARGGSRNTQFFVSGSYSEEDGILIRDEYDRVTGRLNVTHTLSEAFELGANLGLSRTLNNRLSTDNGFATPLQLVAQAPISPIFVPGTETSERPEPNPDTEYFNALLYKDNASHAVASFRSLGNVYGQLRLAPGLSVRSEFGVDLLDANTDEYYNSRVARNTGAPEGLGVSTWDRILNVNTNNYATYARGFGEHDVETVAGITYQEVERRGAAVEGRVFPNDDFQTIASAAEITAGTSTETGYRFLGYFGRANYDYADRYFVSASGRLDGSSRFGSDNRYGFFPAAAAAWVISEEPFFASVPSVSYLKLRTSYGATGNAAINNFGSRGLWGGANFAGRAGIIPTQIPNPDLKWERTTQLNLGLDFSFLGGRIDGEFDVYQKDTDDLLLNVNVPATTGFSTVLKNVGSLENRGVEFALTGRVFDTPAFSWTAGFNISANRNKITNLDGQVIEGGFINRAVEGQPIGVFFGYEYAGVDPANGDALYFVNEPDESGAILDPEATTNNPNEANRIVIGDPNPDFTGGFNNALAFGGFEFNMLWQFSVGGEVFDGGGEYKTANGLFLDNQLRNQLDRWQQPGDVTDVPEPRLFLANGTAESSRYLYDGSYLRLRTLSLAYNLPRSVLGGLGGLNVEGARVYLIGTNLFTATDYVWWDPEVNADFVAGNIGLGNEFYSAPQARSVSLGLQFTF